MSHSHFSLVRFLIANGADVNMQDEFSTASQVAREKNIHPFTGTCDTSVIDALQLTYV